MKIFLGCALMLFSLNAYCFDVWIEERFSGDEIVYSSGTSESLIIGSRGVGYAIPRVEVIVGDSIIMQIDDSSPKTYPLKKIVASTYLIDESKDLVTSIANAKKVLIRYARCNNTVGGCPFSKKGIPDASRWEFEITLAEKFKDYQERVR